MNIIRKLGKMKPGVLIAILCGIMALTLAVALSINFISSKLDRVGNIAEDSIDEWGKKIGSYDHINVLLLGTDERAEGGGMGDFSTTLLSGARSDACMLVSVDMKNHTAALVSLERAIEVEIDGVGKDWLTHVFAYEGADGVLKTVREQFGVDVHRYVRVNVGSAAALIDAIGGVDITLTETEAAALNGEIYSNSFTNHRVTAGLNHLDGFDAIAYARQRFIDSDFHRVQRQRNVIQAAIEQTKTLNLSQLNGLLNSALPLVDTNFSKSEIKTLLPKAPGFLGIKLKQMTLPLSGMYGRGYTPDGRTTMALDEQEAERILNEFFYGDFDPESYIAPDDVQRRVYQRQQEAAAAYNASISTPAPETADSGEQVQPEQDPAVSTEPPQDEEISVIRQEGSEDSEDSSERRPASPPIENGSNPPGEQPPKNQLPPQDTEEIPPQSPAAL